MQRLQDRIAKKLAEIRHRITEPDYEKEARIILLIVMEERLAEIHEWRERHSDSGQVDRD